MIAEFIGLCSYEFVTNIDFDIGICSLYADIFLQLPKPRGKLMPISNRSQPYIILIIYDNPQAITRQSKSTKKQQAIEVKLGKTSRIKSEK